MSQSFKEPSASLVELEAKDGGVRTGEAEERLVPYVDFLIVWLKSVGFPSDAQELVNFFRRSAKRNLCGFAPVWDNNTWVPFRWPNHVEARTPKRQPSNFKGTEGRT